MSDVSVPELDYLLIGHLTADLTEQGRKLGGTPSYAAATAHAFGLRVGVVTSAKPDDPLLDELRRWAHVHVIPSDETTTFENVYGTDGRIQYIRAVASPISSDDVPVNWLRTPLVHIAPMAAEVSPNTVHAFSSSTCLLTLQGWLRQWGSDERVFFRRWHDADVLSALNFVIFSEEDIREAPDMEMAIAHDANTLIVTRAERGGDCYRDGAVWHYETPVADVVNPTGAGDIFAASLLASYRKTSGDLRQSIRAAAHLASISVTRYGLAGAPTPSEIAHVLDTVKGSV